MAGLSAEAKYHDLEVQKSVRMMNLIEVCCRFLLLSEQCFEALYSLEFLIAFRAFEDNEITVIVFVFNFSVFFNKKSPDRPGFRVGDERVIRERICRFSFYAYHACCL